MERLSANDLDDDSENSEYATGDNAREALGNLKGSENSQTSL